ncbi:MAG: hypothetical protein OHK0046_11980 [Anaerolineae bacterium]
MGIRVVWDNPEKTTLRQVFSGRWELDDLYQCADKTHRLISSLEHPVHVIMDLTDSQAPTNMLSAVRYLESRVAPNQGIVVMVGADDFMASMLEVARRIAPRATANGHWADNLEDARRVISENDYVLA